MTGAILNAVGIVAGGLAGHFSRRRFTPAVQSAIKALLGAFTVWVGLSSIWQGLHRPFLHLLGQLGIAALALVLGNVLGKTLRLQQAVAHWAQHAQRRMAHPTSGSTGRFNDGFLVCSLLFCATPMAVIGSLQDGISGNWQLLAVKAVMEGLATAAFVSMLGWGALCSFLPVLAWEGTLTLLAHWLAVRLVFAGAIDSLELMGGFLTLTLALIVFEIRRVQVADYLPALVFAPLLTWVFG